MNRFKTALLVIFYFIVAFTRFFTYRKFNRQRAFECLLIGLLSSTATAFIAIGFWNTVMERSIGWMAIFFASTAVYMMCLLWHCELSYKLQGLKSA